MNDFLMLETDEGTFSISPALVKRIAYGAAYFAAKYESRSRVPTSEGLVQTYSYNFDDVKAKAAGNAAVNKVMVGRVFGMLMQSSADRIEGVCRGLGSDVLRFRHELETMERSIATNWKKIDELRYQAGRDSMQSINRTVDRLETGKAVATLIANTSVDILVVSAGSLTGGAGLAGFKALGALAKGGIKYLETEKVGAALLTAGTEFGISLIPVPGKGEPLRCFMILTQTKAKAAADFVVGVAEGKSKGEALADALASAALGIPFAKIDVKHFGKLEGLMTSADIPVSIRLKFDLAGREVGKQFASTMGGPTAKEAGKFLWQKLMQAKVPYTAPKIQVAEPVMTRYAIMGPDACN